MRLQGFFCRRAPLLVAALCASFALSACSDDQAPQPLPGGIAVVSGDGQYSKAGTELEQPLVFKVTLEDGKPGDDEVVNFHVLSGGGTLSNPSATANSSGKVTVRWTMGVTGAQSMRATTASNSAVRVDASATSSEYYCPEADPTFARKFTPQGNLFLLTRQSSLNQNGGDSRVGLVQVNLLLPGQFSAVSFAAWDEDFILNIVRDCAFSANGDFYVAWTNGAAGHEIMKVAPDRTTSHFATLQSYTGSEIDVLPGGVLAGCDEFGPFTVGCRDTLTRYPDDVYSGVGRDAANHDAMAVNASTGDLYYISLADRRLRRLPLDGYTQTGPSVVVDTLTLAEADSSRGMVVDETDGSVYLLVDSKTTRAIVKVTSAGVKSTLVDFYAERGAGDAAGIQSDLAIDQNRFLYTLDTLNNVILVYSLPGNILGTPLAPVGDAYSASDASSEERVGLAVMP